MASDSLNDLVPSNNPSQINQLGPRIFVICLAAYNRGITHGKWVKVDQELYKIQKEIKKMILESPIPGAEEFGIHASEGFGALNVIGQESIKSIQRIGTFISEVGALGIELLLYYGDVDSAQEAWENHYHGSHESELDFAIELFDQLYMDSIPEAAQGYIDYASFKHDLFVDDYISMEVGGKAHIFSRV
jgi:antirestriction protein